MKGEFSLLTDEMISYSVSSTSLESSSTLCFSCQVFFFQ